MEIKTKLNVSARDFLNNPDSAVFAPEDMPDKSISIKEMNDYGYSWNGMLPIQDVKIAEDIYKNKSMPVFHLSNANTEGEIDSLEDLKNYAEGGEIFGVEAADWYRYLELNKDVEVGDVFYKIVEKDDCSTMYLRGLPAEGYKSMNDMRDKVTRNIGEIGSQEVRNKIQYAVVETPIAPVNMSYWFAYMSNLKKIRNFELIDTSNVADMSFAFRACESLKSLDLAGFDTRNVTNMEFMLSDCHSLKSVDFSSFNTGKVQNMDSTFSGCSNIKHLDLSRFDASNVRTMYGVFEQCSLLEDINLSHFNTPNLEDISNAFAYCNSLKSLDLSSLDFNSLNKMESTFLLCSNLEELKMPKPLKTKTIYLENMRNAFAGCNKLQDAEFLKDFNLSNLNPASVSLDSSANSCPGYAKFMDEKVEPWQPKAADSKEAKKLDKDDKTL